MSESSGEKTEEPTQKKIRDAREKGQVSKSNDVVGASILSCLFIYFSMSWSSNLARLSTNLITPARYYSGDFQDGMLAIIKACVINIIIISGPFVVIAMFGAFVSNIVQVGILFAPDAVKADLNRLNPIEGAKKIFSVKNIVEFLKNCAKVSVIGYVVFTLIKDYVDPLIKIPQFGVYGTLELIQEIFFKFAYTILTVYIIIAFIDYMFQKKQYIKQLRMTKDEVKREYKQMEGDPEIKGKRKQLHQEMVMEDTVQSTKKSSVLVTNPTHYAVALYYDNDRSKLPVVMAKGKDFMAMRMIKAAQEAEVPIMRNVPLARTLYADAMLRQYIPKDLLKPVAEVLIAVQNIKGDGLF
jgi:type III secretion protein U